MDYPYSITLDAANTIPLVNEGQGTIDLGPYVRFFESAHVANWALGTYDAKANLLTNEASVDWSLTAQQAPQATIDQNGLVTFGQVGEEVTITATGHAVSPQGFPQTASMTLSIVNPALAAATQSWWRRVFTRT